MTDTHWSIRLFAVAVAAVLAALLAWGMAGMARADEPVYDEAALAEIRAALEPVLSEPSATRTSSDQTVYTAATGHAGETCDVRVSETNEPQPSEHPGNRLIVTTDGRLIVALDIETGRGGASQTGNIPTLLGETITAEYDFGDDGVSSAGFNVIIDCKEAPPETTTTTQPPTTTTTEPPTTTTTTVPNATTTTLPDQSTTTTTTTPDTTTTTQPAVVTTTVPDIPSGVPTGIGELPDTGPRVGLFTLGGVGLALVALGTAAIVGVRKVRR